MLDMFFSPKSVAIVGASDNPQKVGNQVLANVIASGFKGGIYPINPSTPEILGLKCYTSVLQVPGDVDLAVMVVPNKFEPGVMEEWGKKGVRGAIVITAGFREAGGAGVELEKQVLAIAAQYGIRIIGPNCLGLIDTLAPINASFAAGTPEVGTIAFMSQSGALCTAILDYALAEGIGFSHFVSLGNKSDVDEVALLEDWRDDPQTNVGHRLHRGHSRRRPVHRGCPQDRPQQADHRRQVGPHRLRRQGRLFAHRQPGRVRRGLRRRLCSGGCAARRLGAGAVRLFHGLCLPAAVAG